MNASGPTDDADAHRTHPPIAALPDALTFRLARLVAVNDRAGTERFRVAFGLSLNQWRVLGLTHALSPATINAVHKTLMMDKGQVSRIVRGLSEAGLVLSRPSAADARVVELRLTEKGQTLHDKVLAFTAARNEVVVATLTPEECREFMRIMAKMTTHTEALVAASERS